VLAGSLLSAITGYMVLRRFAAAGLAKSMLQGEKSSR
jgi:hypothetical protein